MENIKPEDVLNKIYWIKPPHFVPVKENEVMIGSRMYQDILTVMREYSQIACSTLSEEIREKESRIEKAESILKHIYENFTYIVNDPDGMNECIEMLENYQLNP